jgi:hypothetical protein
MSSGHTDSYRDACTPAGSVEPLATDSVVLAAANGEVAVTVEGDGEMDFLDSSEVDVASELGVVDFFLLLVLVAAAVAVDRVVEYLVAPTKERYPQIERAKLHAIRIQILWS